jgi:hypothetical protein
MSKDKDPLKNLAKKFEEEEKLNTNPYQQPKESEKDGMKLYLKTLGILVLVFIGLALAFFVIMSIHSALGIRSSLVTVILPLLVVGILIKRYVSYLEKK